SDPIAGNAHLQRNVVFLQIPQQLWVLDRSNTVADALGSDPQGRPNGLRSHALAGVRGQPETCAARESKHVRKPFRGAALFASADAIGDHPICDALRRQLGHTHRLLDSELANSIDNPTHFNRRFASRAAYGVKYWPKLLPF